MFHRDCCYFCYCSHPTKDAKLACNGDAETGHILVKQTYEKIRTAHTKHRDRYSSMMLCDTAREIQFVLKQKMSRLYHDIWKVELVYVEPPLSKEQITVAMKIIAKCKSFYLTCNKNVTIIFRYSCR